MKQPMWIVNSSLLVLLIIVFIFMILSRQKAPALSSIIPDRAEVEKITMERPSLNVKNIYQKDLFETYYVVPSAPVQPEIPVMPPPPVAKPPIIREQPKPSFLPPLNVTLKGIVMVSTDDTKNRATIVDPGNREANYKIGDMIEDAQIIRVFANKVVLLRSNGQQEVLYLREKDAKIDPMFASLGGWTDVVQELKPNEYSLDPALFCDRVKSLAQFIDMLDLTTVYKKGKSIGCRIGTIEKDSLPLVLGLRSGDIIVQINNIPATDVHHRLKIYKEIRKQPLENKIITVEYLRNKQPMSFKLTLEEKKPKPTLENIKSLKEPIQPITPENIKEKERKALREKYNFAPTIKEIRERERANIVNRAKKIKPSLVE